MSWVACWPLICPQPPVIQVWIDSLSGKVISWWNWDAFLPKQHSGTWFTFPQTNKMLGTFHHRSHHLTIQKPKVHSIGHLLLKRPSHVRWKKISSIHWIWETLHLLKVSWGAILRFSSSWWLNQPIWKICSSNWIISPGVGLKIKNIWVATT